MTPMHKNISLFILFTCGVVPTGESIVDHVPESALDILDLIWFQSMSIKTCIIPANPCAAPQYFSPYHSNINEHLPLLANSLPFLMISFTIELYTHVYQNISATSNETNNNIQDRLVTHDESLTV